MAREARDDWCDGRWVGPPSLRIFQRESWPFAVIWYLVVTAIALVICTDVTGSRLFGVLLGLTTGGLAWFVIVFGFSRGWIADGD